MGKIRAFIAVDTIPENKEKISEIQEILKDVDSETKWEPKEKFHITLKFLGDIEENALKEMTKDIINEVKGFGPFSINFNLLGGFPNLKFPRVIWIGNKNDNEPILKLNLIIENIAKNYNFEKENRFHPHITLGRVKGNKGLKEIIEKIKEIQFNEIINIVNEIIIVKSTLLKTGSVYTILDRVSLLK